jgi:hypothetical protein
MVMCSCGMGFFGYDRVRDLHVHLVDHPGHNSSTYREKDINGDDWFRTFTTQKQELEKWIFEYGTLEQQELYHNITNGINTCLVGKAGTGKTLVVKKIDQYLQMLFVHPGEIVRISPLGRVAQSFHYEARTVHATMRLYMNVECWNEQDIVNHLVQSNFDIFSKMKVLIGIEMFMMTDHVLSGLLLYIKQHFPKTLIIFEGDPIQLSTGKNSQCPVLCQPQFDEMFDTIVFDTQKRINNPEQMAALDAMRLCKADSGTLNFWQSKCIEESRRFDGLCLTIYALQSKVRDHNDTMLKDLRTKRKTVELHAIDTSEGRSIIFPSSIERNCMADQILTLAPGVPVFINRNVLARCVSTFKEIYVGNGTPAD